MRREWAVLLLILLVCSGCFGGGEKARCTRTQEYQSSDTIESLRLPSGMEKPEQTEPMDIPGQNAVKLYPGEPPCLERPPDYFDRPVD